MNKKSSIWRRLLTAVLALLQIALIAGVFILDKLANSKAGVNHYVVYKGQLALNSWLTPQMQSIWQAAAVFLLLLSLAGLILALRKKKPAATGWCWLLLLLISGALLLELLLANGWLIFPYALILTGLLWVCQLLQIILLRS